jgi:hypothetical protein
MKLAVGALVLSAGLGMAAMAAAEPYIDYTPQKGATEVITIKVDPNHIDDYLVGLRQGWVPGQELAKKHGVIDWYQVSIKLNGGAGANVVLIQHYPSLASLEPDKARDMALLAESKALEPKEKSDSRIAGYEKYRTFVSDDIWTSVDFVK